MNRNRLYVFLSATCAIGFLWLSIAYFRSSSDGGETSVCLFKRLTNIPCPSCGSTRAVLTFLKGNFSDVLRWNPFGLILLLLLLITPFWIFGDILWKKSTLFDFYTRSEQFLRKPGIAGSAVLIVLANWIWTIYKGI